MNDTRRAESVAGALYWAVTTALRQRESERYLHHACGELRWLLHAHVRRAGREVLALHFEGLPWSDRKRRRRRRSVFEPLADLPTGTLDAEFEAYMMTHRRPSTEPAKPGEDS